MPTLDDRTEPANPRVPVTKLIGLRGAMPVGAANALTSGNLGVSIDGGVAVIHDHVQEFAPDGFAVAYDGSTLADLSELISAYVYYLNPITNQVYLLVVDGAVALTSAGAVAPTDAEIEAALPSVEGTQYAVAFTALFARSGTAITATIDHTPGSFGVLPAEKAVAAGASTGPAASDRYEPFETINFELDAADIADGDLLTDLLLPEIWGRVARWTAVCSKAITTAAKTTTPILHIGAVAVTGSDSVVFTGVKALGEVTALGAPTALNTFGPGSTLSIVVGTTTTFIEGRVQFSVDIERRV